MTSMAPVRISTVISPQNAMTATVMFILVGCGILGNPYKMLSCKMFFLGDSMLSCCQVSNNLWLHVSSGKVVTTMNDHIHMGVSKNSGTPKWMVYNGTPY